MSHRLLACLLALCCLALPARSGTEAETPSLLIPVYDRFEDVGALLTPTLPVELSSDNATLHGELFFSVFHRGKTIGDTPVTRVLLNLDAGAPLFTKHERAHLLALADDERLSFDDLELVGQEGITLPVRQLRVWIPARDLERLAYAGTVEFRAGHYEFRLPEDMARHLRDLARKIRRR